MNFFFKLFQFLLNDISEMNELDNKYFNSTLIIGGGKLDEYEIENA